MAIVDARPHPALAGRKYIPFSWCSTRDAALRTCNHQDPAPGPGGGHGVESRMLYEGYQGVASSFSSCISQTRSQRFHRGSHEPAGTKLPVAGRCPQTSWLPPNATLFVGRVSDHAHMFKNLP